jgi:hypothetical protein
MADRTQKRCGPGVRKPNLGSNNPPKKKLAKPRTTAAEAKVAMRDPAYTPWWESRSKGAS